MLQVFIWSPACVDHPCGLCTLTSMLLKIWSLVYNGNTRISAPSGGQQCRTIESRCKRHKITFLWNRQVALWITLSTTSTISNHAHMMKWNFLGRMQKHQGQSKKPLLRMYASNVAQMSISNRGIQDYSSTSLNNQTTHAQSKYCYILLYLNKML